jgi:succinoglycan biosynthesis protein ExoV
MRLHYCKTRSGNFGDDLNPWLWPRLAPELLDDDPSIEFLGIGTLLNSRIEPGPRRVVFTSGVGYGRPPRLDDSWTISCVRGPLSAGALGIDSSAAVTDGAALVATLGISRPAAPRSIAYMPHHRSLEMADWARLCSRLAVEFVDPGSPVDRILTQISSARLVLTEALHGAVVADALRVPWIAIAGNSHVYPFKWQDWCASMDLSYRPHSIPVWQESPLGAADAARNSFKLCLAQVGLGKEKWLRLPYRVHDAARADDVAQRLREIAESEDPQLSSDSLLAARLDELQTRLEKVRLAEAATAR